MQPPPVRMAAGRERLRARETGVHELSKSFRFEAAHTLSRQVEAEPSRRIHGHSYRAEVVVRGAPAAESGMVVDLGEMALRLEAVRGELDHRFLDDVPGLGPATLENLSRFILERLEGALPGLYKVVVHRDSTGEACTCLRAPGPDAS